MPTKKKHINKLTIALVRVLTLFSIIFVLWLSFFWAEQKYTFNKPTLLFYNIGLYTLNKIPFQVISLIPVYLCINLFRQ